MNVDEYIRTRIPAQHRATAEMVRTLVRECEPEAVEEVSYDMPVFKVAGRRFAWITAWDKGITFGLRQGILIKDRHGLLKGTGKTARNVKLASPDAVDHDVLRDYIRQAVALDKAGGA